MRIRENVENVEVEARWLRRSVLSRLILFLTGMGLLCIAWGLGAFYFLPEFVKLLWMIPIPEQPGYTQFILEQPENKLLTLLISFFGLLALPTLYVTHLMTKRLEQRPLSSVGLHWGHHTLKEFATGMLLGSIFPITGFLWSYWSGDIQVAWKPLSLDTEWLGWIILTIIGLLGIAFWEELCFRGYLLQTLAAGIGLVPAVLTSSLLFGVGHVGVYGTQKTLIILSLIFFGILMAVLYLKTKSLWAPIGMHFMNNFLVLCVLSIPVLDLEFPRIRLVSQDGQPRKLEPLHLFFQTEFKEGFQHTFTWESLAWGLIFYGLLALVVWKLPWFRAHPEMEALWQQYVPIVQPWAQLKAWWAKRKGLAEESSQGPRPPAS